MQRQSELQNWLHSLYPDRPFELAFAAADADFRRYFRATFSDGQTVICMDAPPDKMSIAPYLKVQKLFSMLNVPQVYHADETLGFAALSDLGSTTYLAAMQHDGSEAAHKALLLEAIDELIFCKRQAAPMCCRLTTAKSCCAKSTCSPTGLPPKNWANRSTSSKTAMAAGCRCIAAAALGAAASVRPPRLHRPQPDAVCRPAGRA